MAASYVFTGDKTYLTNHSAGTYTVLTATSGSRWADESSADGAGNNNSTLEIGERIRISTTSDFSSGVVDQYIFDGYYWSGIVYHSTLAATSRFILTSDTLTAGDIVTTSASPVAMPAACYRRNTLILTSRGEVPIEALTTKDEIVTAQGEKRAIRWIGHRKVNIAALPAERRLPNQLVQIKANAIGEGVPRRDLFVSAGHLVLVDGALVAAVNLVNGGSIVLRGDINEVEYFHIECEDEEILVAEGLAAESFFDTGEKTMFDNAPRIYQINFDHRRHRQFKHAPLVTGGLELRRIRARLAGKMVAAA